MIIESLIPILEYDDSSEEVIPPDFECKSLRLPEKCLFAFLGEAVDRYAETKGAEVAAVFPTILNTIKFYTLPEENICLVSAPLGAPASTQILDTLIACGCRKIIAVGSCGALTDIPESTFLIPTEALRDEGTSYHYLPPTRYIELNKSIVESIKKTFARLGIPVNTCTTWTTDGIFRETKDMVEYRREEGCSVVEMECSALAACANKRGALFGQILFAGDSLSDVHEYDMRDFGKGCHEKALLTGLEALKDLE